MEIPISLNSFPVRDLTVELPSRLEKFKSSLGNPEKLKWDAASILNLRVGILLKQMLEHSKYQPTQGKAQGQVFPANSLGSRVSK